MRYRVKRRPSHRKADGTWGEGWVVQMWNDGSWMDVTRVYDNEPRAEKVKELMEA